MKFRLATKVAVKVLYVVVFLMLTLSFVLSVFRMANLFGFVSISLTVDIVTLSVSTFLLAVAIISVITTGYTLNEKGVTFRLLFVKVFTPLEAINAIEYSLNLKVACVYYSVKDKETENVAQMVINIDPAKYAEFAKKLKELKNNVVILPYDEINKE